MGAGTFNEYSHDCVEDVLRVVCGPRHDGILTTYTLAAHEVITLLNWDVDWPLTRRGTTAPEQREKVQGMLPWETEADQSLLSIYQHVSGAGFFGCTPLLQHACRPFAGWRAEPGRGYLLNGLKVLAYCTAITPIIIVFPMMLATGIGLHDARINSKSFTSHQTFSHTTLQYQLKQMPKRITLTKPSMPVLGESGMVRHLAFQAQPAKPPLGQIKVHFLTQAPLRADAVAITNDQHTDHEFGVH